MKKWPILLVGLALVVAASTGVALALTGGGTETPEPGLGEQLDDATGHLQPIRSDEGIDPDECNQVHNITACEDKSEPGIAVGEPYPWPTDVGDSKPFDPDQSVAHDNPDIPIGIPIRRLPGDVQSGHDSVQGGPIIEPHETPKSLEPDIDSSAPLPWTPTKGPNPDYATVEVLAPIESVEVLIMESFPPQYMLVVVSGLPNACVSFGDYNVTRDGDTIRVEVINSEPADPGVACAEVYGMVETRIPLGIDFESGKTYTVVVNNVTETFIAQ